MADFTSTQGDIPNTPDTVPYSSTVPDSAPESGNSDIPNTPSSSTGSGSGDMLQSMMSQNSSSGLQPIAAGVGGGALGFTGGALATGVGVPTGIAAGGAGAGIGLAGAGAGAGVGAAVGTGAGAVGGLGAVLPAIGLLSDERLKENIKETSLPDIEQFIMTLTPKSYDYKNPAHGSHTEGGLMAQDLLKSKIGQTVVKQTKDGLMVDTNKLAPIMAAIFSSKINSLESKIDSALKDKFKAKK